MITVPVEMGSRSYDVLVGTGARHQLSRVLSSRARRAAVVTQAAIDVEVDAGREQQTFCIPDGEAAKSLATVEDLCRRFAAWGLTRDDVVVGVGGGVVTDVAGFAAAVYLRGIDVVHVATTLLAQVDAAIGGKVGVNLPEGKNLVGAFWQPRAVLCDTEVLASLPERERRSGWGEVAKYHFLTGRDLAAMDDEGRIAECVRIKAAVVAGDEREDGGLGPSGPLSGGRAVLNYGHTLAHALETAGSYDLRHGEAVGIGLIYAALLAQHLGRVSDDRVAQHREVVAGYGLPVELPSGARADQLLALMARDKKARDGLRFVLDGPRGIEGVNVEPADATAVLAEMPRQSGGERDRGATP